MVKSDQVTCLPLTQQSVGVMVIATPQYVMSFQDVQGSMSSMLEDVIVEAVEGDL